MTCRELIRFLDDYLSDGLSPAAREKFDTHLRICRDCRNYLGSYRQSIRLGKLAYASLEDELPRDVPESLVQAILKSSAARPPRE
jgi:hypothetical protein